MEDLVESKNKPALTELIKSHLVSGKIFFKELKDGDKLQTVNGKELLVQVKGINVSIGDIAVQARDAKITNGVIHSLDTVLAN